MEKEKSIKGLELCEIGSGDRCYETECPYYGQGCTESLKNDILEFLKEQEAVEPYSMNAERTYGVCPKCGKIVFRYGNVEENHYCGVCGQAVKWE